MPELNAMIAVQCRDGMQFGYVRSADERRIAFEVEASITQGEELDWRMQLIGYPETALGRCVIDQVSRPPGRWPLFHAHITFMTEEDRLLYAGWLKDFAEGGTSRRLERREGEIEHGLLSGARTQTTALHKIALQRIAQRDALRRAIRSKGAADPGDPDAFGLGESPSPEGVWSAEAGRKAIKAALKEVCQAGAPLRPPKMPDPAEAVLEAVSDGPIPDPRVSVDLRAEPPRITVRWADPAVFGEAWSRHLKAGALVVAAPGLDQADRPVEIVLIPPGGAETSCPARVSALLPDGVGFVLELAPAQRRALAAEALPTRGGAGLGNETS